MAATLDVLLLPEPGRTADCLVVVDLLRATTTIATLFERGLRTLTVAQDIDYARRLRAETGAILFGEVGGLPPADFDHGNSPVEASELDLQGQSGVMFTTNGTSALCMAARHGRTMAGSLANVSAVAAAEGFRPSYDLDAPALRRDALRLSAVTPTVVAALRQRHAQDVLFARSGVHAKDGIELVGDQPQPHDIQVVASQRLLCQSPQPPCLAPGG